MARLPTVDEVNAVAERLYASPDPADRQAAQLQLTPFTVEGGDNTVLLNILAHSSNQYALLFAAQGIVSWFKANLNWITQEQREQIVVQQCGIACLQRLILHGAPRHVLLSLLTAYAKMTKLSFEKEPVLKPAVDHALNLFSASQCYLQASGPIPSGVDPVEAEKQHFLSLLLLDTLVTELGKFDSSKTHSFMSFAAHRRSSNNFRDECLLSIFMAVISELELVQLPQQKYPSEVVELTKNCLGYDFMAITVDETEEALSSQVPADWKPFLLSSKTQQVLWGQHATLPYPLCATLLTGLSSLCGIRRTFFDSPEERVEYLNSVLDLLCNVAKENGDRFVIPHYVQIYAEVCQRLVAPFGYRDLHMSGCFARWVETLRAISVDVFAVQFGRDGSFGTTTTLLNFWSRLLMSRRMYVGPNEEEERDLHTMAPDLVLSFVQSRVHFIPGEAGALEEEDYDAAMEAILTQSESVASMALTDFPRTMSMLADYVHRGVGSSVLESPTATAWLFYLAGQLVHQALPHVEENSVEMVSNFFIFCVDCANHRRLALSNNPPPSSGGLHLGSNLVERALIFFINTVQLVLTGPRNDEALKSVIARVFESRAMLFQFILNNTGHNLMRGLDGVHDEESAQIIKSSIDLIANACRDVPPAMLEVLSFNLPPVVDLPLSRSRKTYKLRTNLYTVLWTLRPQQGKMLGVEEFLQPITTCLLNTVNGGSTVPSYVAGWLRDLRGVCRAIHDERQSELVEMVEWFCENAGAFHSVLSGPAGASPMVVVSFLRFLEELVSPHSGRLNLPNGTHSACGLLLFKHMCALLQLVVERCITNEQVEIVSAGGIVDGAYELMLKPLWLSMSCLRRCVHDGFVPFGAMWHYRDETYDNTLLGLLRMLTVFPPKLCKEYPKVVLAVVDLIRTITEEEAYQPLAKLSTAELESIISFVVNVCEDVDTESGSLFHGLSFLSFVAGLIKEVKALSVSPSMTPEPPRRNSTPPSPIQLPSFYSLPDCGIARISGTPGGRPRTACRPRTASREAIARLLEPLSGLWQRLVAVAMNVIVTQDRGLSVSCTVVYPIFEAHPPFWQQFVESFVATYPARKQQAVREALSKLSNDADSQDHFFSGVFTFRQTLRSI